MSVGEELSDCKVFSVDQSLRDENLAQLDSLRTEAKKGGTKEDGREVQKGGRKKKGER